MSATPAHSPAPIPVPTGILVANLIGQIAFGLLAMTICLPSMQEWGRILDASQAGVQLTFSAYVVSFGVCQLVYGPLSDRHGRQRIVQGAGTAAGQVIGRAAVQDAFSGPQKTRITAFIGMAMGLCPPGASIIGGQLHVHLGWQANFWLIAALAVVLMVLGWRSLPPDAPASTGAQDGHWLRAMASAYATVLREPVYLLHVAILGFVVATFYAFLAGAPAVLGSYGVGPAGIGWFIMFVPFSYITGNFLTTRLIRRQGENWLMLSGQLITIAGIALALLLALAGVRSPFAFAMPLMLLGIGHGFLVPTCLARTVGLVPQLAGTAAAVAGLVQQLTGAFGGYAVGWFSHDGAANLTGLMLLFAVLALLFQLAARRLMR